MCTNPLFLSLADGKLHAACSHNQRYLHGVLLTRHKALGHPLYSQPLWDWKPESSRWVSLKFEKIKDIIQFPVYSADFSVWMFFVCFVFLETEWPESMRSAYVTWQMQEAQVRPETQFLFCFNLKLCGYSNLASFPLPRYAEETQAGAGHLSGLRPWGGEPGWVEASQWQPHPGPPVGAGETQPPSRCESISYFSYTIEYGNHHSKPHVMINPHTVSKWIKIWSLETHSFLSYFQTLWQTLSVVSDCDVFLQSLRWRKPNITSCWERNWSLPCSWARTPCSPVSLRSWVSLLSPPGSTRRSAAPAPKSPRRGRGSSPPRSAMINVNLQLQL